MQNVLIRRFHDQDVQLRKTIEIQVHQIERVRFFYIQILIIASCEDHHFNSCVRCVQERDFFAKCYNLNALKEKTCVNCVWKNDSTQCQHRTKLQFSLIYRKLMISNAMYAILRFASSLSVQQFVTMTVSLRWTAHALKSRTIETTVETSSQNALSAQLVRKQTTTQFDSKDLAKKIAKYVFLVRNIWATLYWQKLTTRKRRKEKKKREKSEYIINFYQYNFWRAFMILHVDDNIVR